MFSIFIHNKLANMAIEIACTVQKSPPCSRQDGLAIRVFRNQYYKFLSYVVVQYSEKVATSIKFFPNTY